MLAVDTNVLVRIVTDDDPEQSLKARKLVEQNAVFVGKTVFLEAEWVLRSSYRLAGAKVLDHLRRFARLPQVTIEDAPEVACARAWAGQGLDFADALHLACASTEGCETFATFDRHLATAARKAKAGPVRVL